MTKIIYYFYTFPTNLQFMIFPSHIIFQRFIVFITVYKRLSIILSLLTTRLFSIVIRFYDFFTIREVDKKLEY